MPRENYQERLESLRTDVTEMGALVVERFDMAVEAAETNDDRLTRDVVEGDRRINERYLDLERDCTDLIALQQPVAGDLRLITASFKIITDLERVGDLATNIAGYGSPDADGVHSAVDLDAIAKDARGMIEDALAAYASADSAACRSIAARDDALDDACKSASEAIVRDLIDREFDAGDAAFEAALDDTSRGLLAIRDLERVGDHAVNIAARTLYMVETDDELIY